MRSVWIAAGCLALLSCSGNDASPEPDSTAGAASTTPRGPVDAATTTTAFPFPSAGTVPSSDVSRLQSGDDVVKAAEIARGAWIPSHDPSCYDSDTELNAALDEFGRLPLYMGNLMARAKELGAIDAYVAVNDLRKEVARWNLSRSVALCSAPTTTTTLPTLPKSNVDTNGARPVTLTTTGPFAVDTAFTAADESAPCDGRSPSTRFWLMRYDATLLDWVVVDFARPDDAGTSTPLTPRQPGEHRVEYYAYCGTQDIRSGTADVTVPGLDVTAGPSATTVADSAPTPVYAIVSNASPSVTLRGDATHVIVEPQAAVEWLDGSPTGTVTLRVDGGPWAVLSTRFATIVPAGNDDAGIEVDVVGGKQARNLTVNVVDTTTTTTASPASTTATPTTGWSAYAPPDTAVADGSSGSGGDATLFVILGLVGLAAAAVFLARLRLL